MTGEMIKKETGDRGIISFVGFRYSEVKLVTPGTTVTLRS